MKIDVKRKIVLEAFIKRNITITTLMDASPIPFNGCKTKKKRRRKKKHYIKIQSEIETEE